MSPTQGMLLAGEKRYGRTAKEVTETGKETALNWASVHGYIDHNSQDVAANLGMDRSQLLDTVNALRQDGCLEMRKVKNDKRYRYALTEKGEKQVKDDKTGGTNPKTIKKTINLGSSQVLIIKAFLNHPSFQSQQRIFSSALVRGMKWVARTDETLTSSMTAGNFGYQLNQLRDLGAIEFVDPNRTKEGCVFCPDVILRDKLTGEIIYPVDRPTATEGLEGVEPPSELDQPAALDKAVEDADLLHETPPVEEEKLCVRDHTQAMEAKCRDLRPQDLKFLVWFGENYSNYLFPQEKDVEEWNTYSGFHWSLNIFKQKLREAANLGLVERIETPGKGARTRREYKPIENVTTWLKEKFPESDESERIEIPEVETGKVPDEPIPVEAGVISTEERVAVGLLVQGLEERLYSRKADDKTPDEERAPEIFPASVEPSAEQTESPVPPEEQPSIIEADIHPEESGVVAEEPSTVTHVSTEDRVEFKIRLYYQQQKPQGIDVSQESAEGAGLTLDELYKGLLSLAERGIMRRTMHQGKMVYVMVDQPEELISESASTADDTLSVEVQVHDKVPFLPAIETVDPTPEMSSRPRKDDRCKNALKILFRHVEIYERILLTPFYGKINASAENARLLGIRRERLSRTLSEMAYLRLLGVTNYQTRRSVEPMKYQVTHLAAQLVAEFKEKEKAATKTVTGKKKKDKIVSKNVPDPAETPTITDVMDEIGELSEEKLKSMGVRSYTRDTTFNYPDGTTKVIKETMVF